jgi:hypothetical protein
VARDAGHLVAAKKGRSFAKRREVPRLRLPYRGVMKTTYSFDELGYHTWKDVGGFFGLVLDGTFCAFVIVAALFMMALATILLAVDYLASTVLKLISRAQGDERA